MSDFFTFKVPGYKFMPQYRNKVWDGTIKLYNMFSQTIYYGLLDYVYKFAEDRKYTIDVPNPQDLQQKTTQRMSGWKSLSTIDYNQLRLVNEYAHINIRLVQ